jgi:hypothetical protein
MTILYGQTLYLIIIVLVIIMIKLVFDWLKNL